jgi:hypothetical protein
MLHLLLLLLLRLPTATIDAPQASEAEPLRVLFWNVENLFDTEDNPDTEDNEFLPTGNRRWTPRRYREKVQHLGRVLVDCGAWSPGSAQATSETAPWHPADLIGMAEVETIGTLHDLLRLTPLGTLGYIPLLTHSQDLRGINVALLYRPETFHLIGHEEWHISMPEGKRPTRPLLHAWGTKPSVPTDTLDFVVCHLPSRYGGVVASIPSRQAAHRCLTAHLDSLERVRTAFRLLVMGDMNDYPDTPLLRDDLQLHEAPLSDASGRAKLSDLFTPKFSDKATPKTATRTAHKSTYKNSYQLNRAKVFPSARYNLMLTLMASKKQIEVMGSHKYQGEWGFLDQFFVTGRLLEQIRAWGVFAIPAMLTEDRTHTGVRPLRTYYGFGYEGGYSDHLPIVVEM